MDGGEGVLLLVARARRAPAGRAQAWALSLGREGLQERARGGRSPSLPLPAVAALCEALGALSSMCPAHGREGLTPLVDLLGLSS